MNGIFGPAESPLHLFDHAAAAMAVTDQDGTVIRVNAALCTLLGIPREHLLGNPWSAHLDPSERAAFARDMVDARVGTGPARQAERRLRHADGSAVDLLVTMVGVLDHHDDGRCILLHLHPPGRPPASTRRKRHVAVVEPDPSDSAEALQVHASREATLAALGQRVLGGLDLDGLMGEVAGAVAAVLEVDHVAVFDLRPGGTAMRLRAAVGWDDEQLGLTLLGGPEIPGPDAPATRESPVTLDELLGPERSAELAGQGIHAGAIALIGGTGRPTGVLAIYATRPCELSGGDLELLQAMADLVGAAVEHRSLDAQRRRLVDATVAASEQERATLAAALHEGPVQNLAVLTLRLEQARMSLAAGRLETTERQLAELQASMATEIAGLRRLMSELRPPDLDELGLSEAVREQVRAFQRDTSMDATFESTLAERLRPDLETLLYRVTQEALASVPRRTGTEQRVRIALHAGADAIELRIADDGPEPERHGDLTGIREQVELAGGRWEVTSRPGGGTTLGVSFDQAGA
jgi:PAS domain S-box-containing protein